MIFYIHSLEDLRKVDSSHLILRHIPALDEILAHKNQYVLLLLHVREAEGVAPEITHTGLEVHNTDPFGAREHHLVSGARVRGELDSKPLRVVLAEVDLVVAFVVGLTGRKVLVEMQHDLVGDTLVLVWGQEHFD